MAQPSNICLGSDSTSIPCITNDRSMGWIGLLMPQ
jgi:hypothetical protein